MRNNGVVFEFVSGGAGVAEDVLIVPLTVKPKPAIQMLAHADEHCDGALTELIELNALGDECGALAHTTRGSRPRRILTVSLGDAKKLDAAAVWKAGSAAARWLVAEKLRSAALWIDGLVATEVERPVSTFAGGLAYGGFRFNELRSAGDDKQPPARVRVPLCAGDPGYLTGRVERAREMLKLVDAINYVRRIAHRPPNLVNPTTLAAEARRLAAQHKLKCTIVSAAQARKLNMGGLLAVGGGAAHAPCLIVLEYRGAPQQRGVTALVGKAVTFDTGGYSIKPAQGMETMKFDKCGGVTVLGALKAAAALKLKCNVAGVIAAAENAISQAAYRPSDILRMASGKTVEVTNTDAEGRLVLADALWYAQKYFKPTAMIDLATLTGGVLVALGRAAAGLMCNNDELAAALEECGRRTNERVWRLPLWDEYRELIKGRDSDIKNSSNKRHAHPIVGGMFLKEFVNEGVPWAHLDIAGTASDDDERATGWGVRLLVDYLQRRFA